MITPPEDQDDALQQDDQLSQTENEDQMSQQDVHGNGFDETNNDIGETDESSQAQRAYDAAEPSYTLNLDDDDNSSGDDE
jgi:TATA-binding protein-associated factor Taf7